MWRRILPVCLLLLTPGLTWAQNVPERLLPAGSQIYLRWDGIEKHRAAYDKTALGKMMKGDTGKFLSALWTYLNELMDVALRQADPNAVGLAREIPKVLGDMAQHGFAIGIEVKSLSPPQAEAVFVFPQGRDKGSLLPLVEKL